MRRTPWIAYLWPGLPQLWSRGSWLALAIAIAAAAALNFLLLSTFAWSSWPERMSSGARPALWIALGLTWLGWAGGSAVLGRRQATGEQAGGDRDPYPEAVNHYLKGDYFRTEQILLGSLRRNPRDLESRLLLATLYRHARRREEARRQLDTIEKLEGANHWAAEIESERRLLEDSSRKDGPGDREQVGCEESSLTRHIKPAA